MEEKSFNFKKIICIDDLHLADNEARILYVGTSFVDFLKIQNHFGAEKVMKIGERIKSLYGGLFHQIRNIDDGYDIGSLLYASSPVLERTPYSSDIHDKIAKSIFLYEIVAPDIIVICDTQEDVQYYSEFLKDNGLKPTFCSRATIRNTVVSYLSRTKNLLSNLVFFLKRKRFVNKERSTFPLNLSDLKDADTCIMQWADTDTFGQGVSRETTYFGDIPGILGEAGKKTFYLVSALYWADDYKETVRKALRSENKILLIEDTWSYSDILSTVLKNLFSRRKAEKFIIQKWDLSSLIRFQFCRERWSFAPVQAMLYERAFNYIGKHGIRPAHVMHIFENHAWEKCSKIGVRRHLPDTRIISCVQSPVLETYSNFFFSDLEIKDPSAPDALLICGSRYSSIYEEIGFPKEKIFNIGAPRHRKFLSLLKKKELKPLKNRPLKVLCATNSSIDDCVELILKTLQGVKEQDEIIVYANFHPLSDHSFIEAVKSNVAKFRPPEIDVIYVEKSIQDLLQDIDIFLYCDTNAAFEAITEGIVTVHVGREVQLDYDTVSPGGSLTVGSVADLSALFSQIQDKGKSIDLNQTVRLKMLEEAFGPVREEAILSAFQIEN